MLLATQIKIAVSHSTDTKDRRTRRRRPEELLILEKCVLQLEHLALFPSLHPRVPHRTQARVAFPIAPLCGAPPPCLSRLQSFRPGSPLSRAPPSRAARGGLASLLRNLGVGGGLGFGVAVGEWRGLLVWDALVSALSCVCVAVTWWSCLWHVCLLWLSYVFRVAAFVCNAVTIDFVDVDVLCLENIWRRPVPSSRAGRGEVCLVWVAWG